MEVNQLEKATEDEGMQIMEEKLNEKQLRDRTRRRRETYIFSSSPG